MTNASLLVASTITMSVPLVLSAMGGLTSERAGVMNIGLEGTMLGSACAVAFVGSATQNAWLGLAAGLIVGILLMLIHAVLTQAFQVDHIISGMAINALALGGSSFISKAFLTESSHRVAVFGIQVYWCLALASVAFLAYYLRSTRGGLRLLAVGNDPEKSRQMGLNPVAIRYLALIATGVLAGLAGALILSNAGSFTEGMTGGRGFIALAALIIGGWTPIRTLIACIGFGVFEAIQLQLQGTQLAGAHIPTEFWTSLPYLVTLIALAGFLGKSRPPAGLGKP